MPTPPATAHRIFRFGVFELDAHSGELRKAGARLNVQDQPLQVLRLLLERPGELVTREELRQQLWPSDTFVGFEHGLNAAVRRLRETLGDSAETPRFIETLPRRGYRFIGPIEGDRVPAAHETVDERPVEAAEREDVNRPPRATETRRRALRWAAVVISAGLALSLASWGAFFFGQRAGQRPEPTFHQLTFRRGGVVSARFAPDGKTVVYGAAWDGDPVRIFLTRIEGPESSPLSLPNADVADISASAEMLIILDRQYQGGLPDGTLARVPLAGGSPRLIAEHVSAADWSPDRREFAVSRLIDSQSQLEYPIGMRIDTDGEAWAPRISRNGNSVAFYTTGKNGVAVATADRSGRITILSDGWKSWGRYIAWSPRGDEVWFSASKGDSAAALRAVSRSKHERVVLNLPGWITVEDVAQDGRVLLTYGTGRVEVRCRIANEREERNLSWFSSSKIEDLSRDGKLLLFGERGSASPVPGAYVRRTDGSPPQRLANCRPINLSPDGKWVTCHDELADEWTVHLVPTGPGEAIRMRRRGDEGAGFGMGWLPDSKRGLEAWRKEGGRFQTYIVPIDGGAAQPIGPEGSVCTWASPDGRSALCAPDGDGVSHIYFIDRKELRVAEGLRPSDRVVMWSADNRSLFVWDPREYPIRIYRLDTVSGTRELWREILPPDSAGLFYDWTEIYMTPDGSSYCYSTHSGLNDLYLVEGLR
jgi:DNA-binding winged helix-turn-helix (wHTH) protein/Tol biopolymer transport system component